MWTNKLYILGQRLGISVLSGDKDGRTPNSVPMVYLLRSLAILRENNPQIPTI